MELDIGEARQRIPVDRFREAANRPARLYRLRHQQPVYFPRPLQPKEWPTELPPGLPDWAAAGSDGPKRWSPKLEAAQSFSTDQSTKRGCYCGEFAILRCANVPR
jgi:hypothetical protein